MALDVSIADPSLGLRFHFRCVDLSKRDAQKLVEYRCPSCTEKTGRISKSEYNLIESHGSVSASHLYCMRQGILSYICNAHRQPTSTTVQIESSPVACANMQRLRLDHYYELVIPCLALLSYCELAVMCFTWTQSLHGSGWKRRAQAKIGVSQ